MPGNNENSPSVSVAMAVYNCADTLGEAVESILAQTHADLELIICDDGSADGTLELARKYATADRRIRLIANARNLGLNRSLNRCLELARGKYYARMDGDDVCAPERLGKLVAFLESEPSFALVSSWMTTFDQRGTWGSVRTLPRPQAGDFLSGSPFCHAACMMRTDVLRQLGGYGTAPHLQRCEDLDLWFRLYAAGHKGANIQEYLYSMRDDRDARKRRTFVSRINEARTLWHGFRMIGLPTHKRLRAARPVLVGILPGFVYDFLHRRKLGLGAAPRAR